MEIKSIKFTQQEDGAYPEEITATFSIKEAIFIGKVTGKTRGGIQPAHDIWTALIGDVFNRYWYDGIDEADSKLNVEIPPIRYEEIES